MQEGRIFLIGIPDNNLLGIIVAAYDTRFAKQEANSVIPIYVMLFRFAFEWITDQLINMGGILVANAESFCVERQNGQLGNGENERAADGERILLCLFFSVAGDKNLMN